MLKLLNTMSGGIERFSPTESRRIKMYTCGPSIYRKPHIGNFRTFLYQDVLQRYLEYLGYEVSRLVTLTDVEDKAIIEADEKKVPLAELTKSVAEEFFADSKLLGIEPATYYPRSSTTVDQATRVIEILLERKCAYWHLHDGRRNVYFDPSKFKDFGKLSKLDMTQWPKVRRRFHRDNYPGTPWNKGDFILWFGYKDGDKVYWDADIGKGRPAWNIQDAAMIIKHLGVPVDLACGGIDNLVRHHDYTIAIVESIYGGELCHYWLHGGHVYVDGRKMSKSLGNVYYPSDIMRMGYSPEQLRFFLIHDHYRKRLNFTHKRMKRTANKLNILKSMVHHLLGTESRETSREEEGLVLAIAASFERNMNRDLDVKAAFEDVFRIVSRLDSLRRRDRLSSATAKAAKNSLRKIDQVLKVIF